MAALSFLKEQPSFDPKPIVLYGNSRGAIASAMVAAQVSDLRAIILSSGVYDLKAAFEKSSHGLQQAIYRTKPFWLARPCIMRLKSAQKFCFCTEGTMTALQLPKPRYSPRPYPTLELQSLSMCSNADIEFRANTHKVLYAPSWEGYSVPL